MNNYTDDALLDALILAGWGDTPRDKIPANWLECPPPALRGRPPLHPVIREVREQDLARIQADELRAPMVARKPKPGECALATQLERLEDERRGRAPHRRFLDRPAIQVQAKRMRERGARVPRRRSV